MTSTYQNSHPSHLNISLADDDDEVPAVDYEFKKQQRRVRRQQLAIVGGLLMVAFMAFFGGASNDGSGLPVDTAALAQDYTGDAPKPDWSGEGRYDWQKCKDSQDPNCWKQEGERVGSYWQNFRAKIASFFQRLFGIHPKPVTEAPTETKAPKSTKAPKATEAPVEEAPEEPEEEAPEKPEEAPEEPEVEAPEDTVAPTVKHTVRHRKATAAPAPEEPAAP